MNDKLIVTSCTLTQLLESNIKEIAETGIVAQLNIPEYQRPYVWNEKQINKFLNDWIEYSNIEVEKPLYYLGSIILHQDDKGNLNIIDGQQRITTALLIQKIQGKRILNNIKFSNSKSINQIKKNLSYLKAIKNGDIFEYSEVDILATIDFSKINITIIITKNEDLAYTFFETQNTGGVRLSGSDILKAHHLRAVQNKKMVTYQARRWEQYDNYEIEYIVQHLTKVRFWDNRHWRHFPFYRDINGIKQSIIDEFTIKTKSNNDNISYYISAVNKSADRLVQIHESQYKMLKQPLSNGDNTLDYILEYAELYIILFKEDNYYLVDDRFYEFRKAIINGNNGTVFLKELFEVSILSYVSRFGFHRLFEASLLIFRAIYSLRVSSKRNLREDSVFKFVYDKQFIDNILEVFTPDELFDFLKKMRFSLQKDNLLNNGKEKSTNKTKYINSLKRYFKYIKSVKYYYKNNTEFDKDLKKSINSRIEEKDA